MIMNNGTMPNKSNRDLLHEAATAARIRLGIVDLICRALAGRGDAIRILAAAIKSTAINAHANTDANRCQRIQAAADSVTEADHATDRSAGREVVR